nr:EOG090X005Q [Lepidurus arcticus]
MNRTPSMFSQSFLMVQRSLSRGFGCAMLFVFTDKSVYFHVACNCNGFSSRCFFDQSLFDQTGHGGHCLDCGGNRDGPNCERCKENFYEREDGYCIPCHCSEIGSRSLQCNREGKCSCKPGVTGDKCDRCDANFYEFGPQGCKACGCNVAGSFGDEPHCDPLTGTCACKEHVEGQRCDKCKPGFFNLHGENRFGCTPCFCYGHSAVCRSAPGYTKGVSESVFSRGDEKWTALELPDRPVAVTYNALIQNIAVTASGREPVYFSAPDRYLGDQRASYNQVLQFTLRIGDASPRATVEDIIIEGSGLTIAQPIFGQGNPLPSAQSQVYRIRLHEHPDYGWNPRLSARDFISILANITAIKIKGTYAVRGTSFLDDVKLETARRSGAGPPAQWMERCTCPEGYVGQFCESCAPGYRHEPSHGGPFARCVPCNCNGHAQICDAETGRCICQHDTAGDNCDRCARGFYGNALKGTPNDCKSCPCPNSGACIELADETVVCLECPSGYAGPRCELCSDGYFGDPEGRFGNPRPCAQCDCNTNVDPNAVGNCHRTTGECLKCIYSTAGSRCDQCLPGYYGDALALPKGDCRPCQCYRAGAVQLPSGAHSCDQTSGQCQCKPYVTGKNCDRCQEGYFDIQSGNGCQACNCDPTGAFNHTCDVQTGQCQCRPGVVGLRCDACAPYYYGFSAEGCQSCQCDPIGSTSLQCDPFGQCPCRDNVEGRRCDRCKENTHQREAGCVACPPCYSLVQVAVNEHRAKLGDLSSLLQKIVSNPTLIADVDFDQKLAEVQDRVDRLWVDAKLQSGGDRSVAVQLDELRNQIAVIRVLADEIATRTRDCERDSLLGTGNVTEAEAAIDRAREALKGAQRYLDTEGAEALQKAIERSEKFGQQSERMSEIAREARQLAEQLEKTGSEVDITAQEAYNTSSRAYDMAREAIDQQKNSSSELRILTSDSSAIDQSLSLTRNLAQAALENAQSAYNDALNLLGDAFSLSVPAVEWQLMKKAATDAQTEARKLKEEAEDLMASNGELVNAGSVQVTEAGALLARGVEQQQAADELLVDVDAALARADEAVSLGDKTLSEAKKTFETLQGFDSLVQKSKGRAKEALNHVPNIEGLIEEAEEKTTSAQSALGGAQQDARDARDLAQRAQNSAEQASKEADNIRQGAADTKLKAGELKDAADSLTGLVADTANRMRALEAEAEEDHGLAKEALEKANQAKSNAAESSNKVRDALAAVSEILFTLERVGSIDGGSLDELERKLAAAERDLQESDLDRRLEELRSARITQSSWVRDYEEELARLRLEVDNVQAIKEALPDGCWKRLKLEP